ncbi:MAG: hypothetical protein KJ880_07125 [Candidatus Omnitrophica bacterium]|nr:hypothetical protein [Candidatus Omnitrophota bacterium]MBU1869237.1 hypothetical protein [Candidatus Omnitrophota bacterium]
MSIIFDALKKAEKKEPKQSNPAPENQSGNEVPPVSAPDEQAVHKKRNKAEFVFLIILVGVLLFLTSDFIFKKGHHPAKKPQGQAASVIPPAAIVPTQGLADDLGRGLVSELVLDGVIYDSKDPLAVINGKIMKIGDRIQELEVKSIAPDSVDIINIKDGVVSTIKLQ